MQGTNATNKQKRMKWTEEMNNMLLECKQKAISLTTSDNPPRTENGRKKGYMNVMKDLWEETEYRHLELTSQNLRVRQQESRKHWAVCSKPYDKM